MSTQSARQRLEVVVISRDDLIAILGQEHHGSVDHIRAARSRQEVTDRSSEGFVEGLHVDPAEGLGESGLTWSSTPHLAEDPGVRDG
ncbi:MAG: hypothetical protein ACLGIZ_18345 [Acidimicrobiia bacterium]